MAAEGELKARQIEINDETANLLEARAAALGVSVAELMALIVGNKPAAAPLVVNGDAQAAATEPTGRQRRTARCALARGQSLDRQLGQAGRVATAEARKVNAVHSPGIIVAVAHPRT